jgi:UDP-N-acetylglucosamine transferase subunit ALG13
MDEIALRIPSDMAIQRGYSKYFPRNVKHFDFVPLDTAVEYIRKARLVVSHAGIGTIMLCKEYGIPLLILPRRKKYGEVMNDHQLEIVKVLEEKGDENVHVIYEEDQLEEKIMYILQGEKSYTPIDNVGKRNLVRTIKKFIERIRS